MLRQIAHRVLISVPVVLCVMLFGFALMVLVPTDPAAVAAGEGASTEAIAEIRQAMGLDQPAILQFLAYLGRVLSGDLGRSLLNGVPVAPELLDKLVPTLELALAALVLAVIPGVLLGVLAAVKRGKLADAIVSVVVVAGLSMPVFMTGLLLIQFVATSGGFLPVQGRAGPIWTLAGLSSIIMPAMTLAFAMLGPIARLTRASMIEVLGSNFVRTARAKGLGEMAIVFRHGLRNASIPIVTLIGLLAGYLLGGAVVTETVFAWPGLGQLSVVSISSGDYPMAQGGVLMLTLSFVVMNMLTDIVVGMLDPRVSTT